MYCEKHKLNMGEHTCIARYEWHKKPLDQRRWFESAKGCAKCAQGEKIFQKYIKIKGKAMTDKNQKIKICAHCKQGKPANLEHYYKDARSKDDLGSWCIECQKLSTKKSNAKKVTKEKKKDTTS